MKLRDLIDFHCNTDKALESAAIELRNLSNAQELAISEIVTKIEDSFEFAVQNDNLVEVATDQGTYFAFPTGMKLRGSCQEEIFAYTLQNTAKGDKKFFDLYFEREATLRVRWMSGVKIAEIAFKNFDELNAFLEKLAETAVEENWNYLKSPITQPCLKNYIEQIFYRASATGKIVRNLRDGKIVFHSNLQSRQGSEIYIMADIVPYENANSLFKERYENPELLMPTEVHKFCCYMTEIPEAVDFHNDSVRELQFDISKVGADGSIGINVDHLFVDRGDRLKKALQLPPETSSTILQSVLLAGIRYSLKLARRDYSVVRPQLWPTSNSVQLLLPIWRDCRSIDDNGRAILPDLALCLTEENGRYLGVSAIPFEWAVCNARVLSSGLSIWSKAITSEQGMVTEKVAEFRYVADCNGKNGKINGFFGFVNNVPAWLHIKNLRSGLVTQQEMIVLREVLKKTDTIKVVVLEKDESGYFVALKRAVSSLDELLATVDSKEVA